MHSDENFTDAPQRCTHSAARWPHASSSSVGALPGPLLTVTLGPAPGEFVLSAEVVVVVVEAVLVVVAIVVVVVVSAVVLQGRPPAAGHAIGLY